MPDQRPTSHEQRANASWDASYADDPPPWDIGRPQPAMARLASDGAFTGTVLDAGCGTGEHALLAAGLGLDALGVDLSERAVGGARAKAAARGVVAEFEVGDALRLDRLGRVFETVLDCGLFHTFGADERRAYVASLATVVADGGRLHILCFRDSAGAEGPHPVTERALRAAFDSAGWHVASLVEERIETRLSDPSLPAWLARIDRVAPERSVSP